MGDPENIQDPSVARGKDSRIQDVELERRQYSSNRCEQSRPVLRAYDHRGAIALGKMLDRYLCFLAVETLHQFKVGGNIVLRRREEISVGHDLDKILDSLVRILFRKLAPDTGLHAANN